MRRNALFGNVLCWFVLVLALGGCDERHPELYPDLHSVPDRPTNVTSPSRLSEEVSTMGHDQQDKMEKNKALRKAFHLENNAQKQD
jgi:hypothetical protein